MIFLSEQSQRIPPPSSQKDTDRISDIAQMNGCRIVEFPADYEEQGLTFDDILAYFPRHETPVIGYYNGFIPSEERYLDVYGACRSKNVHLINSPEESLRALKLDGWYRRLADLTPRSAIVTSLDEVEPALAEVGLPVFLKGSVKSLKHKGISACVAENVADASRIAKELLDSDYRSRGRVILRHWEPLRHSRRSDLGFPLGREFRVFVYRAEVVALGYYWEGHDELGRLGAEEEAAVRQLAERAAAMLDVPYVIVDIGQREDGEWRVIEPGDGQFAGLGQVDPIVLLGRLIARAR